ncbi:Sulfatase [compost metagenome]
MLHSLYLFVAVSSFYSLRRWLHSRHSRGVTRENFYHLEIGLPGFLILVAILLTFSDAVSLYFRNSESYLVVSKNFENKSPDVMRTGGKIDVLVYVGESTSIMNMGLYGYPRGTTPRLARMFNEDENFILFNNVFSTHTHTAPSLLEAFSFALNAKEDFLPIERRRRISVVDVLRKAGVDVRLISNQGMVGTWNQASSIVFKAAQKTFSADSRRLGNNDGNISRPWDDVFFDEQLSKLSLPAEGGSSVNFLHSYAGHGAYLANIPEEWRVPVDDYFFAESSIRVAEDGNALSKTVEDYDSAIKYIDYSVSKSIAYVRGLSTAAVLIYFSDHGDSAFTGRAHDSSRFMHEMVRVPFVIYFNDSARKQSPELYRKYRDLAKAGRLSSLAQLPSTILDIVGVRLKDEGTSGIDLKPVVGEETILPPIVVREIGDGISFVNLSAGALMPPDSGGFNFIDSTDLDTRNYLAIKGGKILPGDFCDTAALSFEFERRRQIIGGCALKAELGANRVVRP